MRYEAHESLDAWLQRCRELGVERVVARHTHEIRPVQLNEQHDVQVGWTHKIWLGAYADGVIHQLELQDPPADLRPLLEREWTVRWVRDHIS